MTTEKRSVSVVASLLALFLLGTTLVKAQDTQPSDQLTTDTQKLSYVLGMMMGASLKQQEINPDLDALVRGISDNVQGKEPLLSPEQANDVYVKFQQQRAQQKQTLAAKNQQEADTFLANNARNEGVVTTDSGLQYTIEHQGEGPKPAAKDTVKVHYRGTLIDGTEFDSSYKRGQPATFPVTGVIPGWVEALQLMNVGSKYHLFVPPNLAYGSRGAPPNISSNTMLQFDVELLSIEGQDQEQ